MRERKKKRKERKGKKAGKKGGGKEKKKEKERKIFCIHWVLHLFLGSARGAQRRKRKML